LNRTEVLERIEPLIEGQIRDVRDCTSSRVFASTDTLSIRPTRGARLVEVAPAGAKALVNFTGLPLGIGKELSPNTFGQVLTELLNGGESYSLIVKEDKVTNIAKYGGSRTPVNPGRLLDIIERIIPKVDYNRVLTVDRQIASIEIVGEKTQPVARGDLVRAGVKVDFSPMGIVSPIVQSYAMVLACTNGVTANTILANFTGGGGGEGDDIWQFFRQSIRAAYGSFGQVVEGWKKLRNERIPPADRATILEALIKQARMPKEAADAIRAMAIERPPQNSWEMQNLITYASSHLLEEPRHIAQAQATAADFADEEKHARTCPLCHRSR